MNKYYERDSDSIIKIENYYLNYNVPSHFHKAVELQLILENSYEISIRNNVYTVEQGSLLIIPPYVEHKAEAQPHVKTLLLIMPYEYFNYFPAFLRTEEPCLILSDAEFNRTVIEPFLHDILRLRNVSEEQAPKMQMIINTGWINLIFGHIFSFYHLSFPSKSKKNGEELSEQILEYIDTNFSNPNLSVKAISVLFGYNPSYLSRLFSKTYSVSISKFINSTRIQKFIDLYYKTPQPNILKLSLSCGFSSESTFYRAFYEYTDTTPSEYFYDYNHSAKSAPVPHELHDKD